MGAHGRRERGDQLRHTGPACDARHADVPVLSRVRHGGGERAMLVPDIDHAASLLGQPRGPIHVRIPKERETCTHVLLQEGLGKNVVHAGLGFILHRCNSCIEGKGAWGRKSTLEVDRASLFRSTLSLLATPQLGLLCWSYLKPWPERSSITSSSCTWRNSP